MVILFIGMILGLFREAYTANGGLDHDPGEAGRVSWSLSWSPIRKGIKKRFIIAYSLNKDVTSGKWVQHRPGNTEPIAYQVESSS